MQKWRKRGVKGESNVVNNTIVPLEDNENYAVIDKIQTEDGFYVYLSNIKDNEDICVRKEITRTKDEDDENYLVPLKDETEVDHALNLLVEKNLDS